MLPTHETLLMEMAAFLKVSSELALDRRVPSSATWSTRLVMPTQIVRQKVLSPHNELITIADFEKRGWGGGGGR